MTKAQSLRGATSDARAPYLATMSLTHIFSAVALLATLVLAAGLQGWISDSQFEAAYAPFAWMCFNGADIRGMSRAVDRGCGGDLRTWLAFMMLDRV
jgi:hypothetical protein